MGPKVRGSADPETLSVPQRAPSEGQDGPATTGWTWAFPGEGHWTLPTGGTLDSTHGGTLDSTHGGTEPVQETKFKTKDERE